MKRCLLWILLFVPHCGCSVLSPTPTTATCADACNNGRRLSAEGKSGCEWSAGVPSSGASCEVICENAAANHNPWQLDCLARASECGPLVCP